MKQIITAIVLCLSLLGSMDAAAKSPQKLQTKIERFVKEHKGNRGVESVNLGPAALSVVKFFAKMEGELDADSVEMMSLVDGVKRVIILDFEDVPFYKRAEVRAELDEIVQGSELLMEATGDDDVMRIYSDMSEADDHISHFVMDAGDALICVFGKMSKQNVIRLIQLSND